MNQPLFARVALAVLVVAGVSTSRAGADVVLRPLRAPEKRGANLVPNAGFEETQDGKPAGWDNQISPDFSVDPAVTHGGKSSLRLAKPNATTRFWLSRNIVLDQKRATPLVLSGWSKAENVLGSRGSDYSVWADLQYQDGTPLWGQRVLFDVGTHDWQYGELAFVPAKPVRAATVHVLFRGSATGTVGGDAVPRPEVPSEGGALFDGAPAAGAGRPARLRAAARVATAGGLSLGFAENGHLADLLVDGKPAGGTAPGGFWLRDAAADGPWIRPEGRARRNGSAVVVETAERKAGLRLNARLEPQPNRIDVTAAVQDTTGRDRAVTVYFVLPLPEASWSWHDDIVHSTPAAAQSEYSNAQDWPATGGSSAYPFCSVTTDRLGLTLAAPMDCPRVARFTLNTWLNVLYVAVDLGLSAETRNFPSRADFRFSLYRHAPEWGFRAAAQRYYEEFPQFFVQRLKRGGIWMAFADISKVKDFEEFGFAYDELGGNHTAFDDAHDIASFQYIEPMTYWLSMDKKYPRTYEGAMQALADNEASGKPDLVRWAQAVRRCGVFARDGRIDLSIENQEWCDGAVFTLNPDPGIAEDAACPTNKAHIGYSRQWADKNLLQKEGARLDGIYLDSMPNWGEVLNWRREHWRTLEVPLTFDPATKQPVLLQVFSTWQFSKWVADDVHARGGVMHGNGGALWPYFPALLDVTGQETGSILTEEAMARARTLLRNKPYSPLMNTRFDQMGHEVVEEYFNKSLLYGIFPSFFNGAYMKDGKWVVSRYFTEPRFYERDRPLFRKYIPVLRRLFDAGWQPVTLAWAKPAGVRVERYGPTDGGETLFAVYNPAASAAEVSLSIEPAAAKAEAKATALVAGTDLLCAREGARLRVTVPAGSHRCEVVRLAP